jgi:hypothetical protein
MATQFHLCLDIRGALKNKLGKKSLKGLFHKDNGKSCTHEEAQDYLFDCLAKGWEVLPIGECENFDYKTGCRGHKIDNDKKN